VLLVFALYLKLSLRSRRALDAVQDFLARYGKFASPQIAAASAFQSLVLTVTTPLSFGYAFSWLEWLSLDEKLTSESFCFFC